MKGITLEILENSNNFMVNFTNFAVQKEQC